MPLDPAAITDVLRAPFSPSRRRLLQAGGGLAALGCIVPAVAAPSPPAAGSLRFVQLLDMSPDQQELSRNYATGLRLAWARLSQRQGVLSRATLVTVETDGSEAAVRAALQPLRGDASVIGLAGAVGDGLALRAIEQARALDLRIAHVAPWMDDARHDADTSVVALFASRDTQLQQAMAAVKGMGIDALQVVLPNEAQRRMYADEIAALGRRLHLRLSIVAPASGQGVATLATALARQTGVVLFLGTTIELSLLTEALATAGFRRFVFALANVDPATLQQLRPAPAVPLVLTQVVPNAQRSNLACAREYRAALKDLFDEEPTPLSFAGYLAGLYVASLLGRISGAPTRDGLLALVRSRPGADLQGFGTPFLQGTRGSSYVTQTLLRGDGRLIG